MMKSEPVERCAAVVTWSSRAVKRRLRNDMVLAVVRWARGRGEMRVEVLKPHSAVGVKKKQRRGV